MSTYLSSLLTSTTSRYNQLRRTLLSDESDGTTEDDSHISRVLRAYYTEKGRPFPPWLPPDSKDQQQQYAHAQYGQSQAPYGQQSQRPGVQQIPSRRGGGLSDLWDSPSPGPAQPQSQPAPLRTLGRPGVSASNSGGSGRSDPATSAVPQRLAGARPMPYQGDRGSERNSSASIGSSASSASATGGTTQDKLKARLWGAGKT